MTKEEVKQCLFNTKVYVAGKSAQIQKKLFELGITWGDHSTEVRYTDSPFLYIESETISRGNDMDYFRYSQDKEVTAEYILSLDWNEEISQFNPFDKVLVRDIDEEDWRAAFYSHQSKGKFVTTSCGFVWGQCIPYEGNEELVGTTNKPTKVI